MRFDVITLFPAQFAALTEEGVVARALQRGLAELHLHTPRDYADDAHRTVDDRPYGGGPGMVMQYAPLRAAIEAARADAVAAGVESRVAYLSPQGERLDQAKIAQIAARPGWVLLAGRYEGVDERLLEDCVDEQWSIGDYVLSGGELAAMVVMDAVIRLLPGALGHADSAGQDSHVNGLLDCPHYTRPERVAGRAVPSVLLSGDHGAIERWRLQQALGRTWERRPELLRERGMNEVERQLLDEYRREASRLQPRPGSEQE
jgi:tRNA (guanine37-N1)-methyltransferase